MAGGNGMEETRSTDFDTLFTSKEFVDNFSSFQPKTADFVAAYVVEYVRQKRPVGASGRLGLAVDVGCGTGQNTYVYANHFDRVLATDISEPMVRKAVELNSTRPANVQFAVSSAEDLSTVGVSDGSVDLLTTAYTFHWLDIPRFFAEARRVLAPGGVVAVLMQVADLFHPTDAGKSERLYQLRLKISDAMPRGRDPRIRMACTAYKDVDFPFDDYRRVCVGTTFHEMTVERLRFTLRHSVLFCGEPAEPAATILKSFMDQVMDIFDDDRGRLGDPNTVVAHYKLAHWVVLGGWNGSVH